MAAIFNISFALRDASSAAEERSRPIVSDHGDDARGPDTGAGQGAESKAADGLRESLHAAEQRAAAAERTLQDVSAQVQRADARYAAVAVKALVDLATAAIASGDWPKARGLVLQAADLAHALDDRTKAPDALASLLKGADRLLVRTSSDDRNVFRLAASDETNQVVTGNNQGGISFWSLPDLVLQKAVQAQDDVVSSLQISPDRSAVLVGGGKIPTVWDLHTRAKRFDLAMSKPVKYVPMAKYSRDGRFIATGGSDNRAQIFDARDGRLLRVLQGPSFDEVWKRAAQRAPKGSFNAVDPVMRAVLDATFKIFGVMTQVAFSPDGKYLAVSGVADPASAVRVYDTSTGKLRSTLVGGGSKDIRPGAGGYGDTLAFTDDGHYIVAATARDVIDIFDVKSGKLERTLPTSDVETLALTQGGRAVLSGHSDGSIRIWCNATGRQAVTLTGRQTDNILGITVSQDQTYFATSSGDSTALVWAMPPLSFICPDRGSVATDAAFERAEPIARLEHRLGTVQAAAFVQADARIVTAGQDGGVRIWSVLDRRVVSLPKPGSSDQTSAPRSMFGRKPNLQFDASGRYVAIGLQDEGATGVWDLAGPTPPRFLNGDKVALRLLGSDTLVAVQATPFSRISLAALDGQMSAPEPARDADAPDPITPSDPDWAISPDAARAVGTAKWLDYFKALTAKPDAGTPPDDSYVLSEDNGPRVLLDTKTGDKVAALDVSGLDAQKPAFSPDGTTIVALARGDAARGGAWVAAWDGRTGAPLGQSRIVGGVELEQEMLTSASGRSILVYVPEESAGRTYQFTRNVLFIAGQDGLAPRKLQTAGVDRLTVRSAAVSADGSLVAAGHSDGSVLIWTASDGMLVNDMPVSRKSLQDVVLSPDGMSIVALDDDGWLTIMDRRAGVPTAKAFIPGGYKLAMSPDGAHVVVLGLAGRIYSLALPPPSGSDAAVDWLAARGEIPSARLLRRNGVDAARRLTSLAVKTIHAVHLFETPPKPQRPATATACDAAAADPRDRFRPSPGVGLTALDINKALEACKAALEATPADATTSYQYGRALENAMRFDAAADAYRAAATQGHAAAMTALAGLIADHHVAGAAEEAQALLQKAAEAGDPEALVVNAAQAAAGGQPIEPVLAGAMASGWNRPSGAALDTARVLAHWGNRDATKLPTALFYYELGALLFDRADQGDKPVDDAELRKVMETRIQSAIAALPPSEVVDTYRRAKDVLRFEAVQN